MLFFLLRNQISTVLALIVALAYQFAAPCHGISMSGQPRVRAVRNQRKLKSAKTGAPPGATASPTISPTSGGVSEYPLLTNQEAYDLFDFKHAETFWDIVSTNATDVTKFLDSKGNAKGIMAKKVLKKLKNLIPEDILAFPTTMLGGAVGQVNCTT